MKSFKLIKESVVNILLAIAVVCIIIMLFSFFSSSGSPEISSKDYRILEELLDTYEVEASEIKEHFKNPRSIKQQEFNDFMLFFEEREEVKAQKTAKENFLNTYNYYLEIE